LITTTLHVGGAVGLALLATLVQAHAGPAGHRLAASVAAGLCLAGAVLGPLLLRRAGTSSATTPATDVRSSEVSPTIGGS
jgi:hypothetical protein